MRISCSGSRLLPLGLPLPGPHGALRHRERELGEVPRLGAGGGPRGAHRAGGAGGQPAPPRLGRAGDRG